MVHPTHQPQPRRTPPHGRTARGGRPGFPKRQRRNGRDVEMSAEQLAELIAELKQLTRQVAKLTKDRNRK